MQISLLNTTIHYLDECTLPKSPEPPVAVVLHGWGASAEVMRSVVEVLKTKFRVIAPDLPGFGDSPPPPTAWGVPEYAALVSALMKHLGVCSPLLLGHSFGGRVVLHLAAQPGCDASRLILVDAAGIKSPPGRSTLQTRLYQLGKAVLSRLPKACGEPLLERLRNRFGSADYRAARGVMRQVLVKTVNLDLAPLLPSIGQDALLIWGDLDTATPLWQAQQMQRQLPNAGLAVIPGAGHFCFLDNPALFRAILTSYLKDMES